MFKQIFTQLQMAVTLVRKTFSSASKKEESGAGFTLMEVLVVIAIFSVLVTITGYVYSSSLQRSRDQQRMSDLATINNALEQYYLDHKEYPSYGDNASDLFLAKFQLEPYADCHIAAGHKFLVPTYISSIPEDPHSKFVPEVGAGSSCSATGGQGGQYLYIPVVSSATESVKDFVLAAKVERTTNISSSVPGLGLYQSVLNQDGLVFCNNANNPSCTHNYFLTPKKNR